MSSACDPPGPVVHIAPSSTCNEAPIPQGCVRIPPMRTPPARHVDGVHGPSEYWGAIELPYANRAMRASGGRVLVSVDDPPAGRPRTLALFLDDIPVDLNARELVVYLDLDRFVSGPAGAQPGNDRAFAFDLLTRSFHVRAPRYSFALRSWVPAAAVAGAEGALGDCVPDEGQRGPILRCDAELSIGLPEGSIGPPSDTELPGVGLAVADSNFFGALPDELALELPEGHQQSFMRTEYLTLLFGQPAPIPLRFATWNVRRFGPIMQCLMGDTFAGVDLAQQAELIFDNDVIALQEVWTRKQAGAILEAVNALRPPGDPMTLVGPVDRSARLKNLCRNFLVGTVAAFGQFVCPVAPLSGAPETQGGLWLLSRYPVIAQDYQPFSACRGEDCYKAKGVQWARLWLRPPTADNTDPDCQAPAPGAGCPPGPTSELYVDVFNTHLQASNPAVCGDSAIVTALRLALEGLMCGPIAAFMSADFNCLGRDGDAAIRVRQLGQMAAFISSVTERSSGQMAIVAGDFNIDGRDIRGGDRRAGTGYARILGDLGVGASGAPDIELEPDDVVSPLPAAFAWDIDHGDVARETPRAWAASPCVGSTCSIGTSIGSGRRTGSPLDPEQCDSDRDSRIDYILLRPPRPPDLPEVRTPPYLVSKAPSVPADRVWTATWPVVDDTPWVCEQPPALLSDHRLVVAQLAVIPLRVPPRYHPLWEHDVDFRVMSYNATGIEDCIFDLCGPVDAFSWMNGRRDLASGANEPLAGTPHATSECEGYAGSFEVERCMADWVVSDRQLADHVRFWASAGLFDADDTSGTDPIDVMEPGTTPEMSMFWPTGEVRVRQPGDRFVTPAGWRDYEVSNGDPVPFCTRNGRPQEMCIQLSFDEAP